MRISIHALREEGDRERLPCPPFLPISIHALREEGDPANQRKSCCRSAFLSTPSARRATESVYRALHFCLFLSTPSARRATQRTKGKAAADLHFYPRPPRGGRPGSGGCSGRGSDFYPRPPRGGRLELVSQGPVFSWISIHALREEGDCHLLAGAGAARDFYPRPPRGGRPVSGHFDRFSITFLSTPSARRATCCPPLRCFHQRISIHALREEGDGADKEKALVQIPFLSTPSARRAT